MTVARHRVSIVGSDTVFEVPQGERILAAARRAGAWLPFECGWGGCGTCKVTVVDGETGLVVRRPDDVGEAVAALRRLLDDDAERERMGRAARRRAEAEFSYEVLTARLGAALGI